MPDILNQDIKYLKGVGPARAKLLNEELKVFTLRDLLFVFPYKYIDRSVIHKIRELQDDMPYVQLRGHIVDFETEGEGRKRRLKATFTDGTGFVELVWFNSINYIQKNYKMNQYLQVFGKPSSYNGRISIAHPEMDEVGKVGEVSTGLQAFYHTTEKMKRSGFTSRLVNDLVQNIFDAVKDCIPETLPSYIISEYALMGLNEALRIVHRPANAGQLPCALRRLEFEELFYWQLDILHYTKNRKRCYAGFVFPVIGENFNTFYYNRLPFSLTNAQKRVIREIRRDVATGSQMNRLLQGDVGSGKTLVALMACLMAIDNGFQACLMAPTEILAEQHLETIRKFLGDMAVTVELLTGNIKGNKRKDILLRIVTGEVKILIGTHALIEPTVKFLNLGLVVIDEQHRFGVKQRARLWQKNIRPPHILVMTATPIPRTLAMTVYGDLDVSVIDELPPGRKPVKTIHYYETDRYKLQEGMRSQLREGRQIYVVYPLIKENEKVDLADLEAGYIRLSQMFPEYRVGKIHGKMRPAEKEEAMQDFSEHRSHILVSTTVIEVGVNIPNASVMVIENAERFGLAQLHQLRGRVGRGGSQSFCVLVTKRELSETTRRRMKIMVETTDGFEIAEEDMKLRGPGDLEGTAQSGIPFELRIANILKDTEMMSVAREAAAKILEQDPEENFPQNRIIWLQLRRLKKQQVNFSAIS